MEISCLIIKKSPVISNRALAQHLWGGKDLNLRRPEPTDLQSVAFDRSATSPQIL